MSRLARSVGFQQSAPKRVKARLRDPFVAQAAARLRRYKGWLRRLSDEELAEAAEYEGGVMVGRAEAFRKTTKDE